MQRSDCKLRCYGVIEKQADLQIDAELFAYSPDEKKTKIRVQCVKVPSFWIEIWYGMDTKFQLFGNVQQQTKFVAAADNVSETGFTINILCPKVPDFSLKIEIQQQNIFSFIMSEIGRSQ